jgi:hypothetical protein
MQQMEARMAAMLPVLNEKQRRLFVASEAKAYGRGGISLASQLSGMSRTTVRAGLRELDGGDAADTSRIRRSGAGRSCVKDNIPDIHEKIREIIDGSTYGDPENPLSWTTESLRSIERKLGEEEVSVCFKTVGTILEDMGYSRQANQKMLQVGDAHPDRDAQFRFINAKTSEFIAAGQPVISVDTKKKENIGNFKNNGTEYRKKGDPRKVLDHDFPIKELGKIAPYGVYNLNYNTGFVNVGTSHDTAEFAAEDIARWWECVGKHTFVDATRLFITADCGGSNGYRNRMWKVQLAELAKRIGLDIHVSHFPPGTSKWNKVEHRLFCYISKNWQGKPLIDVQTAINLIGATTSGNGLKVICQTDTTEYELSKKVSDEELAALPLDKIAPYGNWNYLLRAL